MEKRKNILLITSDQQHWCTLGVLNPEIQTPNLDRLAAKGTLFERAYTCNPTCTPTRASIITGQYPSQHGAYSLGTKLPEEVHTVGEDFHKAGYKSALIGKAHFQQLLDHPDYPSIESNPLQQDLDFWRNFSGPFYGFDHVELCRNHTNEFHAGQHYGIWMEDKGLTEWRKYFKTFPDFGGNDDQLTWTLPEEYHYDAWIAERTNAFMQEYHDNDENFFLWASFPDPHPPYLIPEPWASMYDPEKITVPQMVEGEHDRNPPHFQMTQEDDPDFSSYDEPEGNGLHGCSSHKIVLADINKKIAVYYGMVSMMDKYIGKILDKLEDLGLEQDTVVVFSTDHGHFFGQHGLGAKGPFHYEDMVKIPYIVSCPGTVPEGERSDSLQSLVDLAPTFLSIAGIDIPRCMTGIDQKEVWYGETETIRDHVLVENRHNPTTMFHKTYIDERYKLTVYYQGDYGELFDLQEDPQEINNLWNDPDSALLKGELMLKMVKADMGIEPVPMPRVWGA
jgi:uncharacterized sulfatase